MQEIMQKMQSIELYINLKSYKSLSKCHYTYYHTRNFDINAEYLVPRKTLSVSLRAISWRNNRNPAMLSGYFT